VQNPTVPFGRLLGGRYRIERALGSGAMGSVYEGTQEGLGRKVAIKLLHGNLAFDQDAIARFQREAQAAAALGHPNIVQVIDYQWPQGEPPFIVMEHLTGRTLADAIHTEGRLDPARAARIAAQIAGALTAAHGAGIIHRDIKPDNVFLVSVPGVGEVAKVLDFGIAKVDRRADAQLTADGTMLGSPAYMAPEQARGGAIDARADIFALGSTMYRALSGRLPFDAPSLNAILFAIAEQQPMPLAQATPGLDARIIAIVERAMQKDPAGRFQSAAEMRAALESFSVSPPPNMTSAAPSPYAPSQPPMGAAPMMMPGQPAPAPSSGGGGGAAIAVAIIAVVLLLFAGGGAAAFLMLRAGPRTTVDTSPSAVGPATSLATNDPLAGPSPGPTTPGAKIPVRPTNMHDAGISPNAPNGPVSPSGPNAPVGPSPIAPDPVNVVDAGHAPSPAPTPKGPMYSGASPRWSGGTYNKFTIDSSRAAIEARMGAITACYVKLQYQAPDHQFVDYRFRVTKDGRITAFLGGPAGASAERLPALDQCMTQALAGVNVGKAEDNQDGEIIVDITARRPDNP
jgi:serine/threonine-protein kinase